MQDIRMRQNINLSINDSFYYTFLLKFLDYYIGSRFQLNYLIRIITIKTFSRNKTLISLLVIHFYYALLHYHSNS